MKKIGVFLPNITDLKASILTCLFTRLGAKEASWTEFQIEQFETMHLFTDTLDHMYFDTHNTKKFTWKNDLVIFTKESFQASSRTETGELYTITLSRKPINPEMTVIPLCKITLINHSTKGILRGIKLYSQELEDIEGFNTHEEVCRQFLTGILLFLQLKAVA